MFLHETLESLSSIAEAIRHVKIFVKAKRGDDSCFWDVRRKNRYLVIGLHQIQFGEDDSAMETGRQVLKIGKRITVRSSGQVEAAIIATGPPGTIRFGDKVEGRGPGAVRTVNNTGCFQFRKFSLSLLETKWVKAACFGENRRSRGVNVVLNTMVRRHVV